METRGHDRPAGRSLNCEINVTPLVDVMLVVLIIFIVVTPLLHQGVAVDLPRARNIAEISANEAQALTVSLQADGRMFLGDDPIDRGALAGALRARRGIEPGLRMQIQADQRVPYGEIKQILAAGREAGFRGADLIAREDRPGDQNASLAEPGLEGQGGLPMAMAFSEPGLERRGD